MLANSAHYLFKILSSTLEICGFGTGANWVPIGAYQGGEVAGMQGLPDDTVVVINSSGDLSHFSLPSGDVMQDIQQPTFQFKGFVGAGSDFDGNVYVAVTGSDPADPRGGTVTWLIGRHPNGSWGNWEQAPGI